MANDTPLEYKFVTPYQVQGIDHAYDISTYGADDPDYIAIAVAQHVKSHADDGTFIGQYPKITYHRNEILDPRNNYTIGTGTCDILNLCVPSVSVPQATKDLVNSLEYDQNGNLVTPEDIKVANQIKEMADSLDNLKDYTFPAYLSQDSLNHGFTLPIRPNTSQDYLDSLTKSTIPLTTQDSVACRPETEAEIPEPDFSWEDETLKEILDDLRKLMEEDISVPEEVAPVDNAKLTDRTVDGQGTFDWLATGLMNQLAKSVNTGLISKAEVRDVYARAMQTTLQTSADFLIQNEQSFWANLTQKNNMELAKLQALMVKAELLMLPLKVKIEFAQLQAEIKKLEILKFQAEQEKYKIPQIVAQTDQIREQTALICQQRKLAVEQLAQAELDRDIKQRQIDMAKLEHEHETIKLDITREQVVQNKQQSKQLVAQTEQTVEQSKLINAQMQGALKDVKLKDAQLIQIKAQLKYQAQQLLKEREQVALIKAQTASTYANITALGEQIKAAKAQYSDTIDGQPLGGILGAQLAVNKAQAMGFERDSFFKFFSQIQAGWGAKKTADIATLSPNAFNALSIDRITNWYAQKYFNMPNDIFDMPPTYTDYLSDEAMDGTVPTPSTGSSVVKSGNP